MADNEGKVLTRTQTKQKLQRPRMYKVLLHNDDFTPREFVVLVLRHVFQLSESRAMEVMLYVHNNGVGVVGLYPYDVAETKVAEVTSASERANFPLLCSIEPEGGSDAGDSES